MHVSLVQVASIIQSAEEGFQRTEKLLQQLGKGGPLGGTPPSKGPASRIALIKERKVMHCALSSQFAAPAIPFLMLSIEHFQCRRAWRDIQASKRLLVQANGRACTPVMCFRRLWMMRLPLPAARYIPQVLMAQGEAA